jgi:hypothetical protein
MSTPTGTISVNNVETTLNEGLSTNYPSGTSRLTFNDSLVRILASKPSGAISMNDMRGKAGPLPYGTVISQSCSGSTMIQTLADGRYGTYTNNIANSPSCSITLSRTISSNTSNFDMRASAISLGWNGVSPLNFTVTINSGVIVYSTSTGSYAFYISPSFPAGSKLTLNNNGTIIGAGGAGGAGGVGYGVAGYAGGAGGPALYAGYSVSISNSIIYGGGGGGGGGGGSQWFDSQNTKSFVQTAGGAGGNGAGVNGSASATGGSAGGTNAGAGGNGGAVGSSGAAGGTGAGTTPSAGGGGGAAGAAVAGSSNINWLNYGTVTGSVT